MDLAILAADITRKTQTEDLAAYTKVLQDDPKNPLRHDAVAMLNLQLGRIAEAEAEFRESLRLNPESAPTHYNMGMVFSVQRKYEQAAAEFQNAITLDPSHAEAHNNLGAMLHAFGRLDEAAVEYDRDGRGEIRGANRYGSERGTQFSGGSCVLNPDGSIQAYLDNGEGIVYGEIDLRRCRDKRWGPTKEEPWGNRCVENRKGGNKLILHEVGSSERKGKYSQFVLGKSAGSEWRVEVKMPCEVS
jgi:hypothetical protein